MSRELLNEILFTSEEAIYDMEDGVPADAALKSVKEATLAALKAKIPTIRIAQKMKAGEKAALGDNRN